MTLIESSVVIEDDKYLRRAKLKKLEKEELTARFKRTNWKFEKPRRSRGGRRRRG
jgi:hypothetical protein